MGLLDIEVTDEPCHPGLLVVEATVILKGAGVDRLPALATGRTLFCREDQVVILEEPLDPPIAIVAQPFRCGRQLAGEALKIRAPRRERAGRGRRLGGSIE